MSAERAGQSYEDKGLPRLILWTGPRHSGKTTQLRCLVQTIQGHQFAVAGFVAPSLYEDSTLIGFDIVDISTNRRTPLATRQEGGHPRFALLPEGQEVGMDCLGFAATDSLDLIVVDEYGPLELAHQGWRSAVDRLIGLAETMVLLVVREELADQVRQVYDEIQSTRISAHDPEAGRKVMALLGQERVRRMRATPPKCVELSSGDVVEGWWMEHTPQA